MDDPKKYDPTAEFTLVEKTCSVTAFDLRVRVQRDGRERGLWFNLIDDSEERVKRSKEWFNEALAESMVSHLVRLPDGLSAATINGVISRVQLDMASDPTCPRRDVDESALVEWDELKEIYDAIGRQLAEHGRGSARPKGEPSFEVRAAWSELSDSNVCQACGEAWSSHLFTCRGSGL